MKQKVLIVKELKKYFKKNKAVDGISFELNSGEITCLIGPNGSGKTTTIKCILGLIKRNNGEILIDGKDSRCEESRRKLAYIPESPDVYPMLTVWEHLKFIALAYYLNNWEQKAEEILKRFDIYDKKDEIAKNLSKGMKQKLSICCALLHEPEIFLVDEPVIGLDPKAIREMKEIFKVLKQDGKTILISTHILDAVEGFCDTVIVMKKGKVLATGTIDFLKESVNASKDSSLEDVFLEVTENEE